MIFLISLAKNLFRIFKNEFRNQKSAYWGVYAPINPSPIKTDYNFLKSKLTMLSTFILYNASYQDLLSQLGLKIDSNIKDLLNAFNMQHMLRNALVYVSQNLRI